jgi:hypothetical protein
MIIDVILPVYDEEEGLPIFHEAITGVLAGLSERYTFRTIYVLDRCRDASFAVLKEIAARDAGVTVLHLSRRFGHQMSLIAGLDHSDGDASILMDCDMQHPPEVIPRLLERFEQGYDIVQAIRTYDSQIHPAKQWTSRLFYKIQNWLSPIDIPVGSADFRLISRTEPVPAGIVSMGRVPPGHRGFCQSAESRRSDQVSGSQPFQVFRHGHHFILQSPAPVGRGGRFYHFGTQRVVRSFCHHRVFDGRTSTSGIHFADRRSLVYGRLTTDGARNSGRIPGGGLR